MAIAELRSRRAAILDMAKELLELAAVRASRQGHAFSPDGHMQKAKSGVGLMACRTGAAVVPARIFGSFEAFPRGSRLPRLGTSVSVIFGRPLYPADYDVPTAGKARYDIAAERIMARIAALPRPESVVL